jgi:hypothetical protein
MQMCWLLRTVSEFIDPNFVKTSLKHYFSIIENERFGLVFTKTRSINSGSGEFGRSAIDLLHHRFF